MPQLQEVGAGQLDDIFRQLSLLRKQNDDLHKQHEDQLKQHQEGINAIKNLSR